MQKVHLCSDASCNCEQLKIAMKPAISMAMVAFSAGGKCTTVQSPKCQRMRCTVMLHTALGLVHQRWALTRHVSYVSFDQAQQIS